MIQTKRIIFRPWIESDAEELFHLASDPDVGPRAGWQPHSSVEQSLEIINTVFNSDHVWALVLKDSNRLIGCMGYYDHIESNIGIDEGEAEVGYWIGKPFWNQGYCTEALRAMIDYCFNTRDLFLYINYGISWTDQQTPKHVAFHPEMHVQHKRA